VIWRSVWNIKVAYASPAQDESDPAESERFEHACPFVPHPAGWIGDRSRNVEDQNPNEDHRAQKRRCQSHGNVEDYSNAIDDFLWMLGSAIILRGCIGFHFPKMDCKT
jgi:hypothetical protein